MKRFLIYLLVSVLLLGGLSACAPVEHEDGGLSIVCTTFSLYDWTRALVGEREGVELILLADGGKDLHSYEPSIKDMRVISECDLFIGVGGSSEEWLVEYLETSETVLGRTILLTELLHEHLLEEPEVSREPHLHEDEGHSHGAYDEHVWLSPALAQKACEAITEVLCALDGAGAEQYLRGHEAYAKELADLSAEYARIASAAKQKTLVFADRYPFVYLFDECGLSAYAAFPGCTSESEASFETVAFLAEKTDELGLSYLMAVRGSDLKIATTVASAVKGNTPKVLILDSLETVNDKENESYLARMSENARVLAMALGVEQ